MTEPSIPDPSIPDDVEWVRLCFVDLFGTGHALDLPAGRFAEVVRHGHPFDGSALEGPARLSEADMLLVPDVATLRRMDDGLARVVCTTRRIDGQAWGGDPRVALERVLASLDPLAEAYTVAAELEFYLLDPAGRPLDDGGYYHGDEGPGIRACRRVGDRSRHLGVGVDAVHHEAGPGQYEIDLAALPALELADAVVVARQVVSEVAAEVGARASFLARPLDRRPGSGMHLHQRAGSLFVDPSGALTEAGARFVAGQLRHAKALSAFAAPTVNSYKRLHSGPEAPSAAVWARVNRGALVRVSTFREGEASIEYRGGDPSANPYLLLAALLVAGADGIESGTVLPSASEEDPEGHLDAITRTTVFDPLPRDLDEALDAVVGDDVFADAFDSRLLRRLVDGRRAESAEYRSRVSAWELEQPVEAARSWQGVR